MDDGDGYRVLPGDDEGTIRLLDRAGYDPVLVETTGHPTPVAELQPGYLVSATLDWAATRPIVTALTVEQPTVFTFARDISPVFQVARDTWEAAVEADTGMNGRVTRNTDGRVNGAVYVFADDTPVSRLDEFRSGARPIDPLIDRMNDRSETNHPRAVFVLEPAGEPFVIVTIALRTDGQFARTLRDTYDLDPPSEAQA